MKNKTAIAKNQRRMIRKTNRLYMKAIQNNVRTFQLMNKKYLNFRNFIDLIEKTKSDPNYTIKDWREIVIK